MVTDRVCAVEPELNRLITKSSRDMVKAMSAPVTTPGMISGSTTLKKADSG